jgi:hypothetical protein
MFATSPQHRVDTSGQSLEGGSRQGNLRRRDRREHRIRASANALVHRVCLVSFMRADEPPVPVQMLEHRGVQVHGDDVREGGDVGAERVDHMARLGLQSAEALTGANCVRREGSQRRGVRDRRRTALRRAADRSQTLGDQIGSWLTSHSRVADLSS